MENKFLKFPKGFWWGSAWSAEQSEGKGTTPKDETVWERWYKQSPNRFFNNIGPQITTDHMNHVEDDIQLMKDTGHNSLRVSISWARMFPNGMENGVSQEAVDYYRASFKKMSDAGVAVFANLYHFDMPARYQDIGGWESLEVIEHYVTYAKTCFENFGDLVEHWFTFNEPLGPILGSYMEDFHYPNIIDFKRGVQAAFNTIYAHARLIEEFKKFNLESKIGTILNLSPTYPRSQNPADLKAAEIADLFYTRSFLDPMVKGIFPKKLVEILKEFDHLPEYTNDQLETIENNVSQILGLNYYEPRRVKARESAYNPESPFMPTWFFEKHDMPGMRMNHYRGWEIYTKGIYDLAIDIRDNYGNIESFISENGMGVANEERFMDKVTGQVIDDYRIEYIEDHLAFVWKSIEEGCNINGYHIWTFIDCWSWINSYKNRYGLVSLNYETQERQIKKSGEFYKKMSDDNGFTYDINKLF